VRSTTGATNQETREPEGESARASVISAEAAQRANWLTEQRMLHEAANSQGRPAAIGSEQSLGQDNQQPTDVRWSLDRKSKNAFVLRNVGTDVAEEVRIPPEGAAPISRGLPESATLRPQESVEFLMIAAMGAAVPNEILVTWKGRDPDNPLVLPVPRGFEADHARRHFCPSRRPRLTANDVSTCGCHGPASSPMGIVIRDAEKRTRLTA
jgi:hypothetical protein